MFPPYSILYKWTLFIKKFFITHAFLRHAIQKTKEHILHKWGVFVFYSKNNFCIMNKIKQVWSFINWQTSDTWSDNEWYNEWQRMTTSGTTSENEWQRMVQRMTEWQRVRTNGNEWQRVVAVVQRMKTAHFK